MPRLTPIYPRVVLKKLKKIGFKEYDQRGSHLTLKNDQGNKFCTVPIHNKDIPVGTLHSIVVKQAKLTIEKILIIYNK